MTKDGRVKTNTTLWHSSQLSQTPHILFNTSLLPTSYFYSLQLWPWAIGTSSATEHSSYESSCQAFTRVSMIRSIRKRKGMTPPRRRQRRRQRRVVVRGWALIKYWIWMEWHVCLRVVDPLCGISGEVYLTRSIFYSLRYYWAHLMFLSYHAQNIRRCDGATYPARLVNLPWYVWGLTFYSIWLGAILSFSY